MPSLLRVLIRDRRWAAAALPLLVGACVLATPTVAAATRPLATGLTSGQTTDVPATWRFAHIAAANARIVRIGVSWSAVEPRRPQHPSDPSDPAYRWGGLDALVSQAARHRLEILMTIGSAPRWAEGKGARHARFSGTWEPNARAFGKFAHALAARYSGTSRPRVRYFEPWNEPNLSVYLAPQWKRKHGKLRAESPKLFARLTNHFYEGVNSVHKSNRVVAPSTAAYGDPRGGPYPFGSPRMRPVYFLRKLLCLKRKHGRLRPKKKHCRHLRFDIASHHPLDRAKRHGPTYHAKNRDDAGPGDLDRIKRVVRAAERYRTVRPRHKHRPIWVTEFWRASNPPDPKDGIPLQKQARWIEQGLYVFWKAGASAAIYQGIVDPGGVPGPRNVQTGLYFHNLTPKPAYTAFRFPFVAHRHSRTKASVWGKAPAAGAVRIQRQVAQRWQTIKTIKHPVAKGAIFRTRLRLSGKARLRARVGLMQTSLPWVLKGGK